MRFLHAPLVIVATLMLLVLAVVLHFACWMLLIADRLWPGATWGNCWSFAIPKLWKQGGTLGGRPSKGGKLAFGLGLAPHIFRIPELPTDLAVEQIEPVYHYAGGWLIWRVIYFNFRVTNSETASAAPWSNL